jgi:hypothetical protein
MVNPCDQFTISATPSAASLICNILWFISLGLSLASALTATLVEQWAREFLARTDLLPVSIYSTSHCYLLLSCAVFLVVSQSPVKRARIFAYLYYGLQRFRMHAVVGVIPLLLHMSLLFFFGGLVAFLFPVDKPVAYVAAALLVIIFLLYACMTVLPLVQYDCPYKTPLSNVFWNVRRYFSRFLIRHFPSDQPQNETATVNLHLYSMVGAMINKATLRSISREERDKRALAWTMKSLADDDELEPFVVGIPDMVYGRESRYFLMLLWILTTGLSSRPASEIRRPHPWPSQGSRGAPRIAHRASHAELREWSAGTYG